MKIIQEWHAKYYEIRAVNSDIVKLWTSILWVVDICNSCIMSNAQIPSLRPHLRPGLWPGFEYKKVGDQVCDFFPAQNLFAVTRNETGIVNHTESNCRTLCPSGLQKLTEKMKSLEVERGHVECSIAGDANENFYMWNGSLPLNCSNSVVYLLRSFFGPNYTVSQKKLCQCYFLNNSVKHWPMLIIFGTQHHKESWRKWLQFCSPHLNTVATLPCEM